MSSSDYFDPGPNAAYYIWISSFSDLSASVMLYYDYVLTLPQEIRFLWPPHNKQGWFTLACFLNRYLPLIGVWPIAVSYLIPVNIAMCEDLHKYHEWFMIVIQMIAGILCLLRVYALYGRSRRILGFLLSLGVGSFFTSLVAILLIRPAGGETFQVLSPFGGCAQYTLHIGGRSIAIAWAGILVFDSVIFSLTLYKAFTVEERVNILYVIVRDGTMYFSALSLMNLGNIMTLLFAPSFLKVSMTPYTNVFVPSRLANWPRQGYLQTLSVLIMTVSRLSSILVNRLVYNLRELAVKQLPTTVETAGRFQAALPVFRQPLSMIYVQNPSFVMTATREMVASFPEGETPRQQLRTMDVIGYETERRSHVRLSVGRQHPATSASVEAYPL